jgi:hypothetical protein
MSADRSKFPSNAEAMLKEPGVKLAASRKAWDDTENPVFVWEAIKTCTDQKLRLPKWVSGYLGEVAERMTADSAKKSKDLRKVLPNILGFPKKKTGPGRLLDPSSVPEDRAIFALKFLCKLNQEREPSQALAEACSEMDTSFADSAEETLWGWILEELCLTKKPRTKAEWHAAATARYLPFYILVEEWSRRSDVVAKQTRTARRREQNVAFIAAEIDEWVAARARERDEKPVRTKLTAPAPTSIRRNRKSKNVADEPGP